MEPIKQRTGEDCRTVAARSHALMVIVFTLFVLAGASMQSHAQAPMTMYFVHNDHLGTPQVITDKDQNEVWRAEKRPFGEASVEGFIEEHFRFSGQTFDGESGLHYNYFRFYDPSIGRYITSDPIGLEGGINTYLYAEANSLAFTDPDGLNPIFFAALRVGQAGLKILSKISKSEAKRRLRKGGDIAGSRAQMKKLQKQKGKGKPIRERHGAGNEHHHRGDRKGGHAFSPDKLPTIILPGGLLGREYLPNADPIRKLAEDILREFCEQNPFAPNCNVDQCSFLRD